MSQKNIEPQREKLKIAKGIGGVSRASDLKPPKKKMSKKVL